ncbi:MAG: tetratricopeptide repeat protein [Chitinophagaceae bacterium]|nr:tetratricopeptide repeat protein [Chitinophagaceae bacterium]
MLALGIWGKIRHKIPKSDYQTVKATGLVYCSPLFDTASLTGKNAPLLTGLGSLEYKVTTRSRMAQKYFNQGLALTYAFNHGEAARSFQAAILQDSTCAMAYWGLAMVMGPNYNTAIDWNVLGEINQLVENAIRYSSRATPREKGLINALSKRFPYSSANDMQPYYAAYSDAMKQLHESFPDDTEIAVIYADALMNLHPWNLWLKDGTAQPWTPAIMELLENILKRNPYHPGAIHYYIHASEASGSASKALPYADRLSGLMPAAGHLVHMPSHIYIRTGHYHKGVIANEKASAADSTYIAQCRVQGAYPLLLYPHNIHFLAACAFLEGSSQKAMDAAWMVARKADRKFRAENNTVQHFYSIPYYTMVHLARWDEILQQPPPESNLTYPLAIWHYAQGMAYAAKGNYKKAEEEADFLKKYAADESLKTQLIWEMNSVYDLVNLAAHVLQGEIKGHKKEYDQAIIHLRKAIAIEDNLAYTEPPDWFFSARLTLGHWLVKAGRFEDAEQTYLQDLKVFPEAGWALMGLYNSLLGQGKEDEAKNVKARFKKAWRWADITIYSSRLF